VQWPIRRDRVDAVAVRAHNTAFFLDHPYSSHKNSLVMMWGWGTPAARAALPHDTGTRKNRSLYHRSPRRRSGAAAFSTRKEGYD
jgi:hypothetical protein